MNAFSASSIPFTYSLSLVLITQKIIFAHFLLLFPVPSHYNYSPFLILPVAFCSLTEAKPRRTEENKIQVSPKAGARGVPCTSYMSPCPCLNCLLGEMDFRSSWCFEGPIMLRSPACTEQLRPDHKHTLPAEV